MHHQPPSSHLAWRSSNANSPLVDFFFFFFKLCLFCDSEGLWDYLNGRC